MFPHFVLTSERVYNKICEHGSLFGLNKRNVTKSTLNPQNKKFPQSIPLTVKKTYVKLKVTIEKELDT